MNICMNGCTDCTQQAQPITAQHTQWATDCRAEGQRPHALQVNPMAAPSLLCRSYITNMGEYYVRSDLVFRPRKHCGPASARAVPVLVNAMLTIHHLTHITARCCQLYGQPTPARPPSSLPVIPRCLLPCAAVLAHRRKASTLL